MHLTLIPAYGRDYADSTTVQAAFKAGKDFILSTVGHLYDGKPVNIFDLREKNISQVGIRYRSLRKVITVDVN